MKKSGLWGVVLLFAVCPAIGGLNPAVTYQCWDFNTSALSLTPDGGWDNPYGEPTAILSDSAGTGLVWNNGGYWEGGKFRIVLDIDNQRVANPYKLVDIEIIYRGSITGMRILDSNGTLYTSPYDDGSAWLLNGWIGIKETWRLEPNPDWEVIVIEFEGGAGALAALDKLCIRTECVPEPATLAMLLGGALLSLCKRK